MWYTKNYKILPREILGEIKPWIERREIVLIFGARQVGKTSLLIYLKNEMERKGKKCLYLDLEDIELRKYLRSARELLKVLESEGFKKGKRFYLFIDELHYVKDIGSMLKFIHDNYPEIKIFGTGSSSLKIRFMSSEPLTGRKKIFHLYPLSFREFLNFKGKKNLIKIINNSNGSLPVTREREILSLMEEYIIWGSYPGVVLSDNYEIKKEKLEEIRNSYMEREVLSLIKEENILKFSEVMEFIALQNGSLLKINEISKELGIPRITVNRYIKIMEETYIISLVYPISDKGVKQIRKLPKFYYNDTGFLNSVLKDLRELKLRRDKGLLFENAVFNYLQRNKKAFCEIFFWRKNSHDEIDFIFRREKDVYPVEVKFKEIKIPGSLLKFMKKNRLTTAYIFTFNEKSEERRNSFKIKIMPLWYVEKFPPEND